MKTELEKAKAYVDSFESEGVSMEEFCKQFNEELIDKLKRAFHTFEPRRGQLYSIQYYKKKQECESRKV